MILVAAFLLPVRTPFGGFVRVVADSPSAFLEPTPVQELSQQRGGTRLK